MRWLAIILMVAMCGCTMTPGKSWHGPLVDEEGNVINPPTYEAAP